MTSVAFAQSVAHSERVGFLTEYGEVMGVGRAALDKAVAGVLEKLSGRLPAILIDTLRKRWKGLDDLDQRIGEFERRLREGMKDDQAAKAIAAIPGVGLITATAAVERWVMRKPSNLAASL